MAGQRITFAMITILGLAIASPAFGQQPCQRQRLITVFGTAEIKVSPDTAILTVGVETRDKDLGNAKSQNDARFKRALAAIQDVGIDAKDTQTSALAMGPTYSEERVPELIGYSVSQRITVTMRDLSKYEALMTKLPLAGVNRVEGIQFIVTQERKYKDEARTKAIVAAREKAIAMAAVLGQTVGKPWTIEEQASDTDFSSNAGSQTAELRYGTDEPSIASGQITIRASVQISFTLE